MGLFLSRHPDSATHLPRALWAVRFARPSEASPKLLTRFTAQGMPFREARVQHALGVWFTLVKWGVLARSYFRKVLLTPPTGGRDLALAYLCLGLRAGLACILGAATTAAFALGMCSLTNSIFPLPLFEAEDGSP